ncbi:trypsin-like peptidase domain-containing protein [Paracraurococcus ruber]|uniref:F5/8 type C domain-containing protein n=1 Tax=Paracraurococcus ruber TaxID=77675 RepID=A0ABS1D7C5_9PROT|nr:trypsin-like peptidase domain-containing protein [Paracraurococcus ruber]MBK1662380.1 hypothetical protein [Paracraurococcus ruber]TDG28910.1 hypothetical protein E2C05_19205 [Paracraurococcus ruber]
MLVLTARVFVVLATALIAGAWASAAFAQSLWTAERRAAVTAVRVTKPGLAEPERGTAFFVGSQGLLLTAAHVLRGATRIEFGPNPGGPWQEVHPASVEDLGRDVAIFRAFSPPATAGLEVGAPEAVKAEQMLYFAGFPFGLSFDRREAKVTAEFGAEGGWQTQGLAAGGFSGAPALDASGRVVGIVTAGVQDAPGFLQITPLSRVRPQLSAVSLPVPYESIRSEWRPVFKASVLGAPPSCDRSGSPAPARVPTQYGNGLFNLALLESAQASASSLISGWSQRHRIIFLNDGWYNNCRSWIPELMPAWVMVDLGANYTVSAVAFGSEYEAYYNDRAATRFRILVAPESSPGSWFSVYASAAGDLVRSRRVFSFQPRTVRYVRVEIEESVGGAVRIDELEIHGGRR